MALGGSVVQLGRLARLTVGGLEVRGGDGRRGLDIGFEVMKTLDAKPNTAKISVIGLNADHRAQLGATERNPVVLEAGYDGSFGLIFSGEVRRATSVRGDHWTTTLETADGEAKIAQARVNESFKGRTNLDTVVRAAAKSMGVGIGNAESASLKGRWLDGGAEWVNGSVLSGNAARELTRILESAGLEWSLQDGSIQVLEFGKPLDTTAVLLSPTTGLIGSPSIETRDATEDPKRKGGAAAAAASALTSSKQANQVVKCKALLNPSLRPGVIVQVKSASVNTQFRIDSATYTGETKGAPWYADLEGRLQ